MDEKISQGKPSQEESPMKLGLEIAIISGKIKDKLERLWWENGVGKPIFIKRQPTPDDNSSHSEQSSDSPSELAALAFPLSEAKDAEWLIIVTRNGHFVKISPLKSESWGDMFEKNFSNQPYIEIPENEFNIRDYTTGFMGSLFYCEICYNTAVDSPSDELKKQIKNDLDQAFNLALKTPKERLEFQRDILEMTLAKIDEHFGKFLRKSPQEE